MKYHTPESPWYDQTVAEVWFADPGGGRGGRLRGAGVHAGRRGGRAEEAEAAERR